MAPLVYHRTLRQQRLDRGLCQRCGQQRLIERYRTCARCRDRERRRYYEKKVSP